MRARDQSSIFSTGRKFRPDYGLLLELHALTLVARSYALLILMIFKAHQEKGVANTGCVPIKSMLSWGNVVCKKSEQVTLHLMSESATLACMIKPQTILKVPAVYRLEQCCSCWTSIIIQSLPIIFNYACLLKGKAKRIHLLY